MRFLFTASFSIVKKGVETEVRGLICGVRSHERLLEGTSKLKSGLKISRFPVTFFNHPVALAAGLGFDGVPTLYFFEGFGEAICAAGFLADVGDVACVGVTAGFGYILYNGFRRWIIFLSRL